MHFRKQTAVLVVLSLVLLASSQYFVGLFIYDEPSVAQQTQGWIAISDEQYVNFRIPSAIEGAALQALPNPDNISALVWAEKAFPAQEARSAQYSSYVYATQQDGGVRHYYFTGVSAQYILTIPDTVSSEERGLIFASRTHEPPVTAKSTSSLAELIVAFDRMFFVNSQPISSVSLFTDDDHAALVHELAQQRGYQARRQVGDVGGLASLDGVLVQPELTQDWKALQAAAAEAGHNMKVVSGFRDIAEQKEIFTAEYGAIVQPKFGGVPSGSAALSEANKVALNTVMETVAVPGYSKHHTGWAIDIAEVGVNTFAFGTTESYAWLAANNYENARRYGFLPSYPEGGPSQGPEPEAWEYVYVGKDFLRNRAVE